MSTPSKLQLAKMKIAKSTGQLHLSFWFQVMILWGLTSILIWLILRPKHPIYKVVDVYIFHLDGRNSSTFHDGWNSTFHGGSNSTYQNISIILKIEISNPSKRISINHDDTRVSLYYTDNFIGNNSVAGFHQGYRKTIFHEVEVNANQHSWTRIMGRRVDLRVCIRTGVQYVYGIFRYRTNRHQMDFEAYMSIGSDGRKLSGNQGF